MWLLLLLLPLLLWQCSTRLWQRKSPLQHLLTTTPSAS
jgi:hypothetical protein